MKKISIIFTALVMMILFSSTILAQTFTVNTTAAGKIGKELALTETAALHFGTMTVPTGAVNVILSTTNVRTASVPANITLLAQAPVHQTAAYTVYGEKEKHYNIILPANNVVTITSGTNHMHVNDFLPNSNSQGQGSFGGKLDHNGEDTFTVGATLVLVSGQTYGVYTGIFNVTVAYP